MQERFTTRHEIAQACGVMLDLLIRMTCELVTWSRCDVADKNQAQEQSHLRIEFLIPFEAMGGTTRHTTAAESSRTRLCINVIKRNPMNVSPALDRPCLDILISLRSSSNCRDLVHCTCILYVLYTTYHEPVPVTSSHSEHNTSSNPNVFATTGRASRSVCDNWSCLPYYRYTLLTKFHRCGISR